jgi:hypothetical protein
MGVDTLVTTSRGVMGVNVNWPTRLNDAGYLLPWRPASPRQDTAIHLFNASQKRWSRLDNGGPSPQNIYELTSLAYDSKRDRVYLHGAGARQDELWAFDVHVRRWENLKPRVAAPPGASPPGASREAVYLPGEDVVLTFGQAPEGRDRPALWAYSVNDKVWRRVEIPPMDGIDPHDFASQNRAMVYDAKRDLIFLVLGARGDDGKAAVYAMRYRHATARFFRSAGE